MCQIAITVNSVYSILTRWLYFFLIYRVAANLSYFDINFKSIYKLFPY